MAAVRHLRFSKIWFLRTGTPWAADIPSRYQIWCKNVDRSRNYGPKSKSKMAALGHLGFVTSSYRITHEVCSLGYIGLSNFMLIRCIVLKIWRFDFFCRFGLKCLFTSQKFWFLGVRTHKRDWSSSRPQKAHSWPKPHLHAKFGADRSTGATWARAEGIKKTKKKERNLQWQTGCSPRPPTLTQRYVVSHAGRSSWDSSKFQVSSKSGEPFSRNLPFPIQAGGLYNSLYYRTSRN